MSLDSRISKVTKRSLLPAAAGLLLAGCSSMPEEEVSTLGPSSAMPGEEVYMVVPSSGNKYIVGVERGDDFSKLGQFEPRRDGGVDGYLNLGGQRREFTQWVGIVEGHINDPYNMDGSLEVPRRALYNMSMPVRPDGK